MVMEDEKRKASGNGDDVWKSMIEEVKKEAPKQESIDETPAPKQGIETQDSIENKTIEEPIEKPLEKAEEAPKKEAPAKKAGKFTTIMLTKELKQRLEKAKDPHESYGDCIKRLLDKG
jgi:hypothetical protein